MTRVALLVLAFVSGAGAMRSASSAGEGSIDFAQEVVDVGNDDVEEPCDVRKEDNDRYGSKVDTSLCPAGKCDFWDACVPENGECPKTCRSWESVLTTRSQRIRQWVKDKWTGRCPRACRYTDKEMLKPGKSAGFLATSSAFLSVEVPKLEPKCNQKASLGCVNRLTKIASVAAFVGKSMQEARSLASNGKTAECQAVIPKSLAPELKESITKLLKFLEDLQTDPGLRKSMTELAEALHPSTFQKLCSKVKNTTLTDEETKKLVKAAPNNAALSEDQAEAAVQEIKAKGFEEIADELSLREEEGIEKQVKGISQMTSLMQLDDAQQVQMQGVANFLFNVLMSIVVRTVWFALAGSFQMVVCWFTMGYGTDDEFSKKMYGGMNWYNGNGITKFTSAQKAGWLVTCPVMILRHHIGAGQTDFKDAQMDFGLDWKSVLESLDE